MKNAFTTIVSKFLSKNIPFLAMVAAGEYTGGNLKITHEVYNADPDGWEQMERALLEEAFACIDGQAIVEACKKALNNPEIKKQVEQYAKEQSHG